MYEKLKDSWKDDGKKKTTRKRKSSIFCIKLFKTMESRSMFPRKAIHRTIYLSYLAIESEHLRRVVAGCKVLPAR